MKLNFFIIKSRIRIKIVNDEKEYNCFDFNKRFQGSKNKRKHIWCEKAFIVALFFLFKALRS